MKTIEKMAQKKCKLGAGDPKLSKETPQKRAHPAISSKRLVIIRTLSPLVVRLGVTPQREIPNSPTKKPKNKTTPIMYTVKAAVNTPRRNVRQAR